MTKSNKSDMNDENSFMFPVWLITLATMAGTLLVSYAVHSYFLEQNHKENMKQVEMTEYRTSEYREYKNILEKDGAEAATNYLNKK